MRKRGTAVFGRYANEQNSFFPDTSQIKKCTSYGTVDVCSTVVIFSLSSPFSSPNIFPFLSFKYSRFVFSSSPPPSPPDARALSRVGRGGRGMYMLRSSFERFVMTFSPVFARGHYPGIQFVFEIFFFVDFSLHYCL